MFRSKLRLDRFRILLLSPLQKSVRVGLLIAKETKPYRGPQSIQRCTEGLYLQSLRLIRNFSHDQHDSRHRAEPFNRICRNRNGKFAIGLDRVEMIVQNGPT
jgi:hypothetical protein